MQEYVETDTYFGVTCGRYGNRIADGKVEIDGVAFHPGDLLIADRANRRVRRVDGAGRISTLVGGGPTDGQFDATPRREWESE